MTFPLVSFEHYKALRDMDLSHPDIEKSWRLGQMASWSRWDNKTHDLGLITATTQEEFDLIQPLSTSVIFFAINLGGNVVKSDLADWRNFHTEGHKGDSTLKNTFGHVQNRISEEIPAFYMTDVFKLIPTLDSGNLNKKIEMDHANGIDHVERCAEILRKELTICLGATGGKIPTLVAMGNAAFRWLTGATRDPRISHVVDDVLGDGAHKQVVRMDHYTFGSGTHESRVGVVQPLLEKILSKA